MDADNDGDMDLVIGREEGDLKFYYENTGNATNPSYTRREGALNPFDQVADVGSNSAPAFVDADNDGDMDLVIGRGRAISSSTTRTRAMQPTLRTPEERVRSTRLIRSRTWDTTVPPLLWMQDNDGDMDLVIGRFEGDLKFYYENTGSATNPSYTRREGSRSTRLMRLLMWEKRVDQVADVGYNPAFVDADNDGDMDLVIGRYKGRSQVLLREHGQCIQCFVHQKRGCAQPV